MGANRFLDWLSTKTRSRWWNDSGYPDEVRGAVSNGASGVTLNPLLVKLALFGKPELWNPRLDPALGLPNGPAKAEEIARIITSDIAKIVEPIFERSGGKSGRVCAQVDPGYAHDSERMLEMARRLNGWAPNIAVKLPATNAALDVLEECVRTGVTVVMTLGFSVPQAIAVAERNERARGGAASKGTRPGDCYAVVMVGRLDDYLREAAADNRSSAKETDIVAAGVAVVKRAYAIFQERKYSTTLLPSGLRLPSQAADLAGGDMLFSLSPKIQEGCADFAGPFAERISVPVGKDVLDRLLTIRDFARAYEPDGLAPEEFIGFAPTQKTLIQFQESGWKALESYAPR
jgi:transaldolase